MRVSIFETVADKVFDIAKRKNKDAKRIQCDVYKLDANKLFRQIAWHTQKLSRRGDVGVTVDISMLFKDETVIKNLAEMLSLNGYRVSVSNNWHLDVEWGTCDNANYRRSIRKLLYDGFGFLVMEDD